MSITTTLCSFITEWKPTAIFKSKCLTAHYVVLNLFAFPALINVAYSTHTLGSSEPTEMIV